MPNSRPAKKSFLSVQLRGLRWFMLTVIAVSALTLELVACPFCDAPSTTFSEQLQDASGAAHVEWVSVETPDPLNFTPGSTTYKVISIAKSANDGTVVGQTIKIDYYQPGKPGDLFWMLGSIHQEKNVWAPPIAMSQECWNYVVGAPDRNQETAERLKFYLNYLEHPDADIAIDAYGEFAGAPYDALKSIQELLPREKILGWIHHPETTPTRLGLYGLMIGLCGGQAEANELSKIVLASPEEGEVRPGIDGLMAGYVLLTGDEGLQRLATLKLENRAQSPQETFSVLQLLRFLGVYTTGVVERDTLKKSLRILLDDPNYADSVILDLARIQDWDLIPVFGEKYGQGVFAESRVKQSVVRFLQAVAIENSSENSVRSNATAEQKLLASKQLEQIRLRDPATIRAVERRAFD